MRVVTICGSLRFKEIMMKEAIRLELLGNVVLTSVYPLKNGVSYKGEEIEIFNKMHKEKIKLSDEIFVINKDGYIGDATKSEIEFAKLLDKTITYYE